MNNPLLQFDTLPDFAAVNEPGSAALLGDGTDALVPANGDVMVYGDGGAGKRRSAYPAHIRSSHGVDLREHVLDIDQLVESEELISRRAGARGRRLCGHGELSCSDGPGAREFCFRRAIGG